MIRAAQINSQNANMSLDDDLSVGSIVSRRDAVRLLAVSGAAVLAGCRTGNGTANAGSTTVASTAQGAAGSLPSCVAKPELTVGPYFVERQLERSDIRIEPATNAIKEGAPLRLTFNVRQIATGQCTPLPGAMVDVWQCDADGSYSGVNDQIVGFNTLGKQFLRGYQVTDANGVARFVTIYPGWYRGRAVHIHFKVRTPADAVAANRPQSVYEFTSQLFFDESLTDRVHAQAPYAAKGQRDRRNENDGIYRQAGDTLLLAVAAAGDGYDASFDMGLDLSDSETGRPDGWQRGRP